MSRYQPQQIRINLEVQRPVRIVAVDSSWGESSALTIEVKVVDLFYEDHSYWIAPQKLGPPMSEMEVLAWAAS